MMSLVFDLDFIALGHIFALSMGIQEISKYTKKVLM